MNKRKIDGTFAGYKLINEEWECHSCKVWTNSVSWFCIVDSQYSEYTCPKCSYKLKEMKND